MQARKKPTIVEVRRWTLNDGDDGDSFGNDHMANWLGKYYRYIDGHFLAFLGADGRELVARQGDYIACQVLEVSGHPLDFWPIVPDVFNATYERIDSADLNSAGFPDPASMGGVISQGGVASVREVQPDRPTRGPANDKPDCCSGFVTQEGRDIHQAIEHEPRRTYPPCGQPVAAGGPCLRDAGHYGVCSAARDSAQQEPR